MDRWVSPEEGREIKKEIQQHRRMVSLRLTHLGVPIPSSMVLSKSSAQKLPIFNDFLAERNNIATKENNLQMLHSFIALITFAIVICIVVILVYNRRFASSYGLFLGYISTLLTLTYMVWLKVKYRSLEANRKTLARRTLEERKKLIMVEPNDVEADQRTNDRIDMVCYLATEPLNDYSDNIYILYYMLSFIYD